jgi:hypothetical protein
MHWFDELSIDIANSGLSRRTAIAGAVAFVASTVWLRPFNGVEAFAQTGPVAKPPARSGAVPGKKGSLARRPGVRPPLTATVGPCRISRDAKQDTLTYAAEVPVENIGSLHLNFQKQTRLARASARATPTFETFMTIEITFGPQLVVSFKFHFSPIMIERTTNVANLPGTLEITGGPLITGLRSAALAFRQGGIEGTINGKPIRPTPITRNLRLRALRYADGSAMPAIGLDARIENGVRQLQSKAEREMRGCFGPVVRSPAAEPIAGFQNTPTNPDSPPCQGCWSGCNTTFGICMVGAALTCGAAAPACLGELYACEALCFIPGFGGCCQTGCSAFSCCDNGQVCCGSDVCCSSSSQVCASAQYGACCGQDNPVGCGDETAVVCCPQGASCCSLGQCCPPNTACMPDGTCCPSNLHCGGVCCSPDWPCQKTQSGSSICCNGSICGNECCPHDASCVNGRCGLGPCGNTFCGLNACCNGACCPPNAICINEACCPLGQVCGKTCCPSGQQCQNANTGTCGVCATGTSPVGCTNAGAPTSTACCPPNVVCCNGRCCPAASDSTGPIVCCAAVQADTAPYNQPGFGCHHIWACSG